MDEILSQRNPQWANQLLGTSKYYIHAFGGVLTSLAEILGLTPDVVNNKLIEVGGFSADSTGELSEIIWEKIVPAFPGWSANYIAPYQNDQVVEALNAGRGVIVQVATDVIGTTGFLHGIRYIGSGKCHDPFTGSERPTSDFPDVKSFIVLTKVEATPESAAAPQSEPVAPLADNPAVTLANLPLHEKQAICDRLEAALSDIKKLLAL